MTPKLAMLMAEMQESRRVHQEASKSLQQSLKKFNSGIDKLKLELQKAGQSLEVLCNQSAGNLIKDNVIVMHRRAS